jgi:hypothetical protein
MEEEPEEEDVRPSRIERPSFTDIKQPRLKKFKANAVIHLLVKENPKRAGSGSHRRYGLYTNGMTVEEALEEGITAADLDYDNKKEFIRIVA